MIPKLFSGDATVFTNNGLGRLAECTRCEVTEERNGIFECEFDYPVNGALFEHVKEGNIIAVTHDANGDIQPFDIYARSAPIDGLVTFYAHHISYRLSNIILKPISATSCAGALGMFAANTYNHCPFSFWTDKAVNANWSIDRPSAIKAVLGGSAGSILDVYGKGCYKWDIWQVKLYTNRGSDRGVSIRYGVNMTDIRQEVDTSGSYSAVAPFWSSEDTTIYLPEGYIVADTVLGAIYPLTDHNNVPIIDHDGNFIEVNNAIIKPVPMDLTSAFSVAPTVEQLREEARRRLNNSQAWLPDENITVSFADLSQTSEYKSIGILHKVMLDDTVTVHNGLLGISGIKTKVIKTRWDSLDDHYIDIELGTAKTSFADVIMAQVEEITDNVVTADALNAAVTYATDLINGGLGGYVVMTPDADGKPQEILIMDTPDKSTAVNVWRWNKNGLGHSHTGYSGPFSDVAITQDGKINANMITAGTLDANLLRAGIIQDQTGTSYWNLASGVMNILGQFAAQTSNAYGAFRMELADGSIKLYRTNGGVTTTPATIEYNEETLTINNVLTTINSVALKGNNVEISAGNGNNRARVHCSDDGEISLFGGSVSVYTPTNNDGVWIGDEAYTGTYTFETYDGVDPNTGLETWVTHSLTFINGILVGLPVGNQ